MIQLYHVHKRYANGTDALVDMTLRVREGEFVFLTGPSGAGKSTLLRLLMVMERATDGQILIGGRNIHVLRDASVPFLRRNIGMIFQDFKLIPRRSVFDNVAISLEIMGLGRKDIARRVETLLDGLRLGHRLDALPGDLSAGEQQRVAIARALVNEPAILLADEPTGNLDPDLGHDIIQLLLDVGRRGTTVIVATHDLALVQRYGMRTLTLARGQLVEDRPRAAPLRGHADLGDHPAHPYGLGHAAQAGALNPLQVAPQLSAAPEANPAQGLDPEQAPGSAGDQAEAPLDPASREAR